MCWYTRHPKVSIHEMSDMQYTRRNLDSNNEQHVNDCFDAICNPRMLTLASSPKNRNLYPTSMAKSTPGCFRLSSRTCSSSGEYACGVSTRRRFASRSRSSCANFSTKRSWRLAAASGSFLVCIRGGLFAGDPELEGELSMGKEGEGEDVVVCSAMPVSLVSTFLGRFALGAFVSVFLVKKELNVNWRLLMSNI